MLYQICLIIIRSAPATSAQEAITTSCSLAFAGVLIVAALGSGIATYRMAEQKSSSRSTINRTIVRE